VDLTDGMNTNTNSLHTIHPGRQMEEFRVGITSHGGGIEAGENRYGPTGSNGASDDDDDCDDGDLDGLASPGTGGTGYDSSRAIGGRGAGHRLGGGDRSGRVGNMQVGSHLVADAPSGDHGHP